MHELGVTKALIKGVLDEAERRGVDSVKEVFVEVGMLTTYSGESIAFYYDILKEDEAVLEDSKLNVKDIEGIVHCKGCGKDSELSDMYMFFCPLCDSPDIEVIKGKEFIIKEIRV